MKRVDNFVCDYYRLVYNTFFGNDERDFRYIGIALEKSFYDNFKNEIPGIGNMITEFANIQSLNLEGSADTAWNKHRDFVENFSTVKTQNPYGINDVPFSI